MSENNKKRVLLKIKHVDVKFRVRGRVLNAIRDANLDIYENETLAIVGESGSGKSVLTKTFAGMLDSNGFISHGNVYFYDEDIAHTEVRLVGRNLSIHKWLCKLMEDYTYDAYGAEEFLQIEKIKDEIHHIKTLSVEKEEEFDKRKKDLTDAFNDAFNRRGTLSRRDPSEAAEHKELGIKIKQLKIDLKNLEKEKVDCIKQAKYALKQNHELAKKYEDQLKALEEAREAKIEKAKQNPLTEEEKRIAREVASEIILSVGRYPLRLFIIYLRKLIKGFGLAYSRGRDLTTEKQRRRVFEPIVFRVEYRETISKETNAFKLMLDQDFAKYVVMDDVQAEVLDNETLIDQARSLHPHLRKGLISRFLKAYVKAGKDKDAKRANAEKLADLVLLRVGQYDSVIHANVVANKIARWMENVIVGGQKDVSTDMFKSKPAETLVGFANVDCAKVRYLKDWEKIRGRKIATVFQDPMTSLNPILTIGKQIMMVIQKHQKVSKFEAKRKAIDMMRKVGIPNPEKRFDDYPFQYSGGMRQRIVIAIALSCQPKILICDEPTTALDVTIQAQIIRLIKKLSKDLGFTTVYITHDLGVVANVADRVAVLYGGQIVELGDVEDIFYDPYHPYTWALLSSMPQLGQRGEELFSIAGTPPSLYNKIVGDAFAPRNQYALAIDFVKEPPMFEINDHHWAKTWLLDPRAPKVEKPQIIQNLHEKMSLIYKDKEEK